MARAGLAYAAMLAASVSAGALGYAVIWAYTPDEPAALTSSVSAALAPPAEVAAQAGPPGVVAPVVVARHAPASEPVTASASAIAAAHAEPLAPPVASDIPVPRAGAAPVAPTHSQPAEVVVVRRGRPSEVARQSIEMAPRAARAPAAVVLAARPVEASQTRPVPGVVMAPPAEAPVVRSAPAASPPVTPREHAPVGSTTRPAPAAAPKPSAPPRLAALPSAHAAPAVASDAPQILILRGGLRRATSVRPQRLAAAPAPDTAAHDTRVTVLRGGALRSAHTALLPVVQPPAIAVVRGTRPVGLAKLAAPGPLVLRIRD